MHQEAKRQLVHRTIKVNVDFFERRFQEGYGIRFPESHVIRFNLHVLKHRLGITGGRLLDFGCALGTHARYFADNGFDVVACDSSPTAIAKAKALHPDLADHFFVNDAVPDFAALAGQFDVIFCHQVLAYFTNPALRALVDRFHAMTRPGGVFFATQYPTTNGISGYVTGTDGEMSEITLHGRLSGCEYVNFKTIDEMVEDFRPYRKLNTGFTAMQLDDEYGSNDQLIYIGLKD
jgi:2-polyprenyl-3-methyl-5-hydroxy-6-metoxy-1,4-benzoquinol methylase